MDESVAPRRPRERRPSFPFYARDFIADDATSCMTPEELGGYILLLCHAWLRKRPGHLPADDKILASLSRLNGRWPECREAISRAFKVTKTEWVQKRMHKVGHQESHESSMRSARARAAATARWNKQVDARSMPKDAIAFAFASASANQDKKQDTALPYSPAARSLPPLRAPDADASDGPLGESVRRVMAELQAKARVKT